MSVEFEKYICTNIIFKHLNFFTLVIIPKKLAFKRLKKQIINF